LQHCNAIWIRWNCWIRWFVYLKSLLFKLRLGSSY
jgi:hypothetical protein